MFAWTEPQEHLELERQGKKMHFNNLSEKKHRFSKLANGAYCIFSVIVAFEIIWVGAFICSQTTVLAKLIMWALHPTPALPVLAWAFPPSQVCL